MVNPALTRNSHLGEYSVDYEFVIRLITSIEMPRLRNCGNGEFQHVVTFLFFTIRMNRKTLVRFSSTAYSIVSEGHHEIHAMESLRE